ncbi:MAG: hypothetical protein VYE73_03580 [Acidobacteriota bacterium]|nr:hypothetical protein [Acidobacteriota bacterium]
MTELLEKIAAIVCLGVALSWVAPVPAVGSVSSLAEAEEAWARRGEGYVGPDAEPTAVVQAIAAFETALVERPRDLEVMWKLLRAIEFRGEYTAVNKTERRRLYAESVGLVERALSILHGEGGLKGRSPEDLAREVSDRPHAAAVHYWSALHYGLFGDTHGAMSAIRKGVAKHIRLHAETATLIDPEESSGGGARVLGRMHSEAPKVPLFTGWIDRNEAVRLLEEANAIAPDDPFNRVFLADVWLSFRPRRSGEAIALLRSVVEEPAPVEAVVEHAEAARQAREILAALD